ncbi:MAG: cytochrome c biogenesis protein ResB [Sedimentisphaerales bacterium]|nr:cytochrome c biogenesis protein ResB [Sedimentisphaerales bacterium]
MMNIKETTEKFRHAIMWAVLAMVVLLILLSIYGAFLGAQGARAFFNSPILSAYWLVLMALLVTVLVVFGGRLISQAGLLLMHSGCILVLAGALWGSGTGLKVHNRLFGADKIQKGQMVILEGIAENRIRLEEGNQIRELPFRIKLKDFRVEYYKPEDLEILTPQGRSKIPVEIGSVWFVPDFGDITVIRVFENLKISAAGDRKTIVDDPQGGFNPALEVRIKKPDGNVTTRYVFERFPDYVYLEDKFLLRYHKPIRDYISDVQVIKDEKVIAEKSIEVNHPLHFGGYHFYQSSCDEQTHMYTVLSVVSDTGLELVYAGYLVLGIGVFWHFWFRHFFTKRVNGN